MPQMYSWSLEDALLIDLVGEKVAEYADTRSVADLFSCSSDLRGTSSKWWPVHAVILKAHAQRLYKKAMAANLLLPPYTRRIDSGVSDPTGSIESPPLHPRDYGTFEQSTIRIQTVALRPMKSPGKQLRAQLSGRAS